MALCRPCRCGSWQTHDVRSTHDSPSGAVPAWSRWKGSLRSPYAMVALAAFVYVAMSVTLVAVWGSELDRDAVFPGGESPSGEVT